MYPSGKTVALETEPVPEYGALMPRDVLGAERSHLRRAVDAARQRLLALQHDDGHWCAELEGDTILESEYVLCLHFLGRAGEERVRKAANTIRKKQLAEGGWTTYPGGPTDVSASVKAYLVLKLVGDDPSTPHMVRARQAILDAGGLDACNSFTRLYLAIFGQYPWSKCPAVPPELMLLPRNLFFNLYSMSSWSRAIFVPLSMIWAYRPFCGLPEHAQVPELQNKSGGPVRPAGGSRRERFWGCLFRGIDVFIKTIEALRIRPFRRRALGMAEAWILKRLVKSDGLGAIFPPIINTLIALRCHGYSMDHPVIQEQMRELERLEIEADDTLRVQPCMSPVWDTTLALNALLESGLEPDHPAALKAARWLLAKEVREPGDCQLTAPDVPIGGWYFEYQNECYPDCDDTFEVIKSLIKVRFTDEHEAKEVGAAIERGKNWVLAMQNPNGGWAAFDRDCTHEILTYIPFADHNAMIDPPTVDITSRGLKTLSVLGMTRHCSSLDKAHLFVLSQQEADGSWYGRWGCNYLYGTWLALCGLRALGGNMQEPRYQRAAAWIRGHQNPDGGWGELPLAYDEPQKKGHGPSTATQTAWALMGLLMTGDYTSAAVRRGIAYLLSTQHADGTWQDESWTGTGFPKVFYLHYHLYATYFPLQALGLYEAYRVATGVPEIDTAREHVA